MKICDHAANLKIKKNLFRRKTKTKNSNQSRIKNRKHFNMIQSNCMKTKHKFKKNNVVIKKISSFIVIRNIIDKQLF